MEIRKKLWAAQAAHNFLPYVFGPGCCSIAASSLRRTKKHTMADTVTEMKSLTGSARNTANTLFSKNRGSR